MLLVDCDDDDDDGINEMKWSTWSQFEVVIIRMMKWRELELNEEMMEKNSFHVILRRRKK